MIELYTSGKELRQEFSKLLKNVSRRVANIERRGDTAFQYGATSFREFEEKIGKNCRKYSDEELRDYYRDLSYISSLKSSTVKGAERAKKNFEPIYNILRQSSPTLNEKFWKIYGKLVESNALFDKYKYDLISAIMLEGVIRAQDEDEVVKNISEIYREAYEEAGGREATENDISKLFISALEDFTR